MSRTKRTPSPGPTVFGWKEWIQFLRKRKPLRAKFDTGARTSSIHAENIKRITRHGEDWVAFTIVDPNRDAEGRHAVRYECPIIRIARVRNADGQQSERIVVELEFWLGGETHQADFTLNTRHDMLNPVLLGRFAIKKLGLVDAGRTYLHGKHPKKKKDNPAG